RFARLHRHRDAGRDRPGRTRSDAAHHPDAALRQAGGNRGGDGVPGVRRRRLHHGPGHPGERRHVHGRVAGPMSIDPALLTADFKLQPYWWDAAPRPPLPPRALPQAVDVAIVGSGHTGLVAALTLARAGRSVAVFEAGEPGQGASSRNAGYVGRSLKHSFGTLVDRYGVERAVTVYRDMRAAFDWLFELVEREQINCKLVHCGRFIGALSS